MAVGFSATSGPSLVLAWGVLLTMSYAELHCLTNFSFLEAASNPDELVARAAGLGYSALGVTDINTLAGVVRANTATKEHSPLKLIVGAEIRPVDASPVVVWVKNRQGYGNLCRLITSGRRRAPKGECRLTLGDIAQHAAGLLAGVVPPLHGEEFSIDDAHRYRDIFDEAHLLAELHRGPHDRYRRDWLRDLSRQTKLPLVAAGNVLFHVPDRKPLHDVLTAIRLRTTVAHVGEVLQTNAQRHLRPLESLKAIYADMPGALERTLVIAEQCKFSLDELRYEYPEELAPTGFTPIQYLRHLTWQGAEQRYPHGLPEKVRRLLEHELNLIEELRYEPYFLTVWDIVRFARSRDILCQGRGSAANSAVCYCLGVPGQGLLVHHLSGHPRSSPSLTFRALATCHDTLY
jgi:error-prone DNA polymerase